MTEHNYILKLITIHGVEQPIATGTYDSILNAYNNKRKKLSIGQRVTMSRRYDTGDVVLKTCAPSGRKYPTQRSYIMANYCR
ncbi:hypothetical protein [Deefgea piscis]|uniref:hypothetical protein n=1 Tax=Deefgea piscis TaxID=2739061 RepID=UPI001C80B414|nr:hypothetical protein [Deefgea piscis]QZA81517.1 hypothetical protein K4H25_02305 [Deefgea piscis]